MFSSPDSSTLNELNLIAFCPFLPSSCNKVLKSLITELSPPDKRFGSYHLIDCMNLISYQMYLWPHNLECDLEYAI
ncbi:hypothetical protein M5K25_010028 [Dendrobium thyrsiflorum]|uniref:Uncharacterized protein n=1 Tax=Dendrobium thyrsiflorum TaxID=117978 RepID=A0ABD0UZ44_DENTH